MDAASAIVLTVVLIALVAMLCYVAFAKEKKTLHYLFITIIIELIVWNTAVLGGKYVAADPGLSVFVDNFAYFGAAFVPVTMLLLGLAYQKSFKGFSRAYRLLFVFPVITMVVIFTNDFHHLFYLSYTPGVGYVQGPYFVFYALYSYACLFTGMGLLCYTAIKTSGVLSLQALLNVAAALIPTVTNICYTLHVPGFYVYTTPVAFTITVLLYIVSLFRFGFLKTVPHCHANRHQSHFGLFRGHRSRTPHARLQRIVHAPVLRSIERPEKSEARRFADRHGIVRRPGCLRSLEHCGCLRVRPFANGRPCRRNGRRSFVLHG